MFDTDRSSSKRQDRILRFGQSMLYLGLHLGLLLVPGLAAADQTLTSRLDSLFAAGYPASEPGAAVRIQLGDEVLLRKGYGLADMEMNIPIAPEMPFRLCSITKQFTAVGVLMLAAEGRVDLEAPLGDYVTDYPQPGSAATVHQLLTHTSGIRSYTDDSAFWETACLDQELDEFIDSWKYEPLDFPPGSDWHYSNSGYVLLGKLIEVVTGKEYPEFMDGRIGGPLGLRTTMYDDPARIIHGRVHGHERQGDVYRNAPYVSMALAHAAGAMLSSVDDMAVWCEALFESERLLAPEWRDRLLAPAILSDGRTTSYACGFEIHEYAGHTAFAHGGGGGGFATFMAYVPDYDLSLVVLSNNAGTTTMPQALGQRAVSMILGGSAETDPRPSLSHAIEIRDESIFDALVGCYELVPGFIVRVRNQNAALTIQPTGQPALRIYPSSESQWFTLEIDARIEFQGLGDGQADSLVLVQNGRAMPAARVECGN